MVMLVWKAVIKRNILLPSGPTTTLDLYLKLNTYVCTKTFPRMLIVAVFVMATTWKHPRYPSVGKLIKCGPCRQWIIQN